MRLQVSCPFRCSALALSLLVSLAAEGAGPLDEAIEIQTRALHEGSASQERVDRAFDSTRKLLETYSATLRELEGLRRYNDHLAGMTAAQETAIQSLAAQAEGVQVTQRDVVPLMARMVDTLDRFVSLDLPFRLTERQGRIAQLRATIDDPDLSLEEKYRRVLEAYQVETDYGRTVDAYRAPLTLGDRDITVDFLRVGRIALLYRSLDGGEVGLWDRASGSWGPLAAEYRTSLDKALRVARKESAPDLLMIPIAAPESAP